MENEKLNTSTKKPNKFLLAIRKWVISLKRDFYIIPLIFIAVVFIQFTFKLYVLSPAAIDINASIESFANNPSTYTGLDAALYGFEISASENVGFFIFVITLCQILMVVSFIFFKNNNKEGNAKKKWVFFGLYFFVSILIIVFEVMIITFANLSCDICSIKYQQLIAEGADTTNALKNFNESASTISILTTNIVLDGIAMVVVALSPLFQKLMKKVKFKRISTENEQASK